MFFNNEERLKITLLAVMKRAHNMKFITTVEEVYSLTDEDNIVNKKNAELVKMTKSAISGINKGVYKAEMLFDYCKGNDEDLNAEIESRLDEPINNDYFDNLMRYYASIKLKEPLLSRIDQVIDLKTKITAGGIDDSSKAMEKLEDVVHQIKDGLDTSMSTQEGKTLEFDVDRIIGFAETMQEMDETETFRLYSGCGIDDHFDGFAPTKSYNFVGIPGGGKSFTLFNLALKLKDNNHFDNEILEGKKPIIIYATLENTREQTLSRALSYHGLKKDDIRSMSMADRRKTVMKYLSPKKEDDIRLSIKQFKRYTIDGPHLTNLINDYENRGYKVMALVVDYLDLLEYNFSEEDKHNSKMPIVKKAEDLKVVANECHIPVITASQTNRGGESAIKEAKDRGKNVVDPIKSLNGSHIAAGYQIKGEVDFMAFVYKGVFNGTDYLAVKDEKKRDKVKGTARTSNGYRMSVMPLDGFRISNDEVYESASELFPDEMNTINVLNETNKEFKKLIESEGGEYDGLKRTRKDKPKKNNKTRKDV